MNSPLLLLLANGCKAAIVFQLTITGDHVPQVVPLIVNPLDATRVALASDMDGPNIILDRINSGSFSGAEGPYKWFLRITGTFSNPPPPPLQTESPEEAARRLAIIDLAHDQHCSEEIDIDGDSRISDGDDNGCYVSAWLWVDFSDTPFDKGDDEDDDEEPV
jgi:hypothetical protein